MKKVHLLLNKLFIGFISCLILLTTSCGGNKKNQAAQNGDDIKGNISISGAFALYPLAVKWAEEFQKIHPNVRIDLSAGGAGKGMTDVLADVVDLGMVSREVYDPELEKGALPFATAKDAVVITINASNPLASQLMKHGISKEIATKIWITGEYTTWGQVLGTNDNTDIHVYTRSDACGAAETFALWMDKKQEDLLGTAVYGDPGLASAIQADKLGIGLNNIGYAYDENSRKPNQDLLVCPVDSNNDGRIDDEEYFYDTKDEFIDAVANDKYPSPPARDLYLVSHGVPQKPALVAFLEYVLGEGQQYNLPVGYISLSEDKLTNGLNKLHGAN
ncbi:MAG: PstS family phosphate ABC transporter substrate-binding protein [Bacteroidales bacterium]|nr:PstS family phosphate ABC transporter substrate-binding protein [Bacteroidales bacterium]